MPLKIYVARDAKDREWPPNMPHEAEACEWMLQKAWMEFQHLPESFAVIVNLKDPSADMVVIREIGLGVLELKHHSGRITVDNNGAWWAANIRIHSGNRLNPREQVRSYAKQLRGRVIRQLLPARMQGTRWDWYKLKFQTGVCFTNPLADLQELRKSLEKKPPVLEDWEDGFSVIDPDLFTSWVRELRFELAQDPPKDYAPMHLEPEKIERMATEVLGAVEWREMIEAMPEGRPYGHLILEDAAGREVFNLVKDHSIVGRSHQCDIVLPSRFSRVSKEHLEIKRNLKGITVTDPGSRNGTFMGDKPVKGSARLEHDCVLSLGGPSTGSKSCVLRFVLHGMISDETTVTELGTRDIRHPAGD